MLDKIVVHGYENPESKDFWQKKHWESIKINYKKSTYFDEFAVELEEMYLKKNWKYLIDICWHQFNFFRKCLGLDNKEIVRMSDFSFEGTKDDLVLDHCKKLKGDAVVFGCILLCGISEIRGGLCLKSSAQGSTRTREKTFSRVYSRCWSKCSKFL